MWYLIAVQKFFAEDTILAQAVAAPLFWLLSQVVPQAHHHRKPKITISHKIQAPMLQILYMIRFLESFHSVTIKIRSTIVLLPSRSTVNTTGLPGHRIINGGWRNFLFHLNRRRSVIARRGHVPVVRVLLGVRHSGRFREAIIGWPLQTAVICAWYWCRSVIAWDPVLHGRFHGRWRCGPARSWRG